MKDWITDCTQSIAEKGPTKRGRGQYSSGASLKRIAMAKDRMKAMNDRAANTEGFHEGQLVLFYNPPKKKGLSSSYKPVEVDRAKYSNVNVYRIQNVNSPRTEMKFVHKERLAKYGNKDNEHIQDEQA